MIKASAAKTHSGSLKEYSRGLFYLNVYFNWQAFCATQYRNIYHETASDLLDRLNTGYLMLLP